MKIAGEFFQHREAFFNKKGLFLLIFGYAKVIGLILKWYKNFYRFI